MFFSNLTHTMKLEVNAFLYSRMKAWSMTLVHTSNNCYWAHTMRPAPGCITGHMEMNELQGAYSVEGNRDIKQSQSFRWLLWLKENESVFYLGSLRGRRHFSVGHDSGWWWSAAAGGESMAGGSSEEEDLGRPALFVSLQEGLTPLLSF